jgi:hypothetical protein
MLVSLPVEAAPPADALLPRAVQRLRQAPDYRRALGLAEMYHIAGQHDEAINTLAETANQGGLPREAQVALHRLACWRMLPLDASKAAAFRQHLDRLEAADNADPWATVFELLRAAVQGDRQRMVELADRLKPLQALPGAAAEEAHLALLVELGFSRNTAALAVIRGRDYQPLYALRDLDRALTREADFLASSGQAEAARKLRTARDALRNAWLASSRHLVERLFALGLLERQADRAALLERAQRLPFLQDQQELDRVLAAMAPEPAWQSLLGPLLHSEVAVIDAPPQLPRPEKTAATELTIRAKVKRQEDGTARYDGPVEVTFGRVSISCQRLDLSADSPSGQTVLKGAGQVVVRNMPGFETRIAADRLLLRSEARLLQLEGDVVLQSPQQTLRCESCTLTLAGELSFRRTLLDELAESADAKSKLALLPRITKRYSEEELPAEARYLLALTLLRPHLTWQAAYPPDRPDVQDAAVEMIQDAIERLAQDENAPYDWRWAEAHGGEEWMHDDVPREKLRQAHEELEKQMGAARGRRLAETKAAEQRLAVQREKVTDFFWRLKDPGHADVQRAIKLLGGIREGQIAQKARHWLAEIERNNTVLTMDVTGCYAAGKVGPVVIDVRNAERISARLYRVRRAEDLLSTAARIGEHFIYRDYGLQTGEARHPRQLMAMEVLAIRHQAPFAREAHQAPKLQPDDLVEQWDVDIAQLKTLDLNRQWHRWQGEGDDDEERYDEEERHFGDACDQFRPRLKKTYWPGWERLSSWQCDRLLEVPGDALKRPGAYVLVLEANGQTACAPIVVDPLSLTMRRCRDGVFCLVSDSENRRPLAGARVRAPNMLGDAVTDAAGVCFARACAGGERPIVVEKDGRYAVGGFGAVFEGIYRSQQECEADYYNHMNVLRQAREVENRADTVAQVYTDRYVIAALTDRPTYRPGQTVQFKLIVRRMPPLVTSAKPLTPKPSPAREEASGGEFRAGEFDWADHLEVPETKSEVGFQVLNPAGRIVHSGSATLNDFGTAAASIPLSSESKVGSYVLRVSVGGMDRLLPEAFSVRWYRRPNFELKIAGLPAVIKPAQELTIQLEGRYYFGKPVAAAKAELRLNSPRGTSAMSAKTMARAEAVLDSSGAAKVGMKLSERLAPGEYRLVAALTDGSGRTVTTTAACRVEGPPAGEPADPLSALGQFIRAGDAVPVKTSAAEVTVSWQAKDGPKKLVFPAQDGVARVTLAEAGWYLLTAGQASRRIFAFGGSKHPLDCHAAVPEKAGDGKKDLPRWINLTDYGAEEDDDFRWDSRDRDGELWALLDRQQVGVGEKLRVLVYVPAGATRLLLTIEGRTIVDYLVARTDGSDPYRVIEVPIKRRYLPNFYLQGRVLSEDGLAPAHAAPRERVQERALAEMAEGDGSEDPQWCRLDVVDPDALRGGQRLNVAIETDAATYRPGEKVGVRIRTSDLNHAPREAEVSLAAVDESVFSFGEDRADLLPQFFTDPHPERAFMRKKWRASYGAHQIARLLAMARAMDAAQQQLAQEAAKTLDAVQKLAEAGPPLASPVAAVLLPGAMPVTNISLARLRSDFRETAAWQPQLRTDHDGLVETSFVLPDSLTRYRLTGVGLTREAEIGVARTRITATMPLTVQLFLPRFAVEHDRLEAVGLVHNNSDRARTCQVAWEVSGAEVATTAGEEQWHVESRALTPPLSREGSGRANHKTLVRGKVQIGAGQSARVAVPLAIDRLQDVQVSLRAGEADESDAEQRTVSVQPLGRPREVVFAGSFGREHELRLPAGFVATDFRLSLARCDVAGALDGLGYLIDYPYGCVEQTMSRFLPAVMAKRAAQEAGVALPPEAAAKLPDVLQQGLQRLYNFQHSDGSWGWWEHDAANDGMSAYVVYGLARCRSTGTAVDLAVLDSGCSFLSQRLRGEQMSGPDRASAWLALALAGRADAALLRADAQKTLAAEPVTAATASIALACRTAGLTEPGERLFGRLRPWKPGSSEEMALLLTAQVAFGAPLDQCRGTAAGLLGHRHGQRWESTRATAWAIEALAQMLRYDVARPKPARVTVNVGGNTVLDLARPEDLAAPVYRVALDRTQVSNQEGLAVRMRVDDGQPVNFLLSAVGIQRLDNMAPEGQDIKLTRTLATPDGRPAGRRIKVGDVVAVHLHLELGQPQSCLIIEDRRPAGCEFADEQLDGEAAHRMAHFEFRDDRVCAFAGSLPAGKYELIYYLRAETHGTSNVLPGEAYPMYNERLRGTTGGLRLEIE